MWWKERGDFTAPDRETDHTLSTHIDQSESTETDQSEQDSTQAMEDGEERSEVDPEWSSPRVAQFTEYSISSSVVPRNKGEWVSG